MEEDEDYYLEQAQLSRQSAFQDQSASSRMTHDLSGQAHSAPPPYQPFNYNNNQRSQQSNADLNFSTLELNSTMMEIFKPFDKDGDGNITENGKI